MGAQIAKNGAKDETAADGANKSNGQENGHAKTNGDVATEDVQVNGKHSADGEVKAEGGAEKTSSEADGERSAITNSNDSTKPEENGAASASSEPAKQKKRFSFKKPFKLSGFSFKKSAKKEADGGEGAVENGEEKKDAEPEETKPEASSEEGKTEAPAEEPKAEEPAESSEEKPSSEVTEKQAENAPQEPAAVESSESPAAATE